MNENLNLVEILKNCPRGTKLYSTLYGEVQLKKIYLESGHDYPIEVSIEGEYIRKFTNDGKLLISYDGECILFPSKNQRDWSKFKVPVEKFNPKTLQPFDKVLVRGDTECKWYCDFFSHIDDKIGFVTVGSIFRLCIPYNDETKHLVGTSDDPDEKYIWWK